MLKNINSVFEVYLIKETCNFHYIVDVHSIRLDQSKGTISQVYGGGLDR